MNFYLANANIYNLKGCAYSFHSTSQNLKGNDEKFEQESGIWMTLKIEITSKDFGKLKGDFNGGKNPAEWNSTKRENFY